MQNKGLEDLFILKGLKKSVIRKQMMEIGIPFPYTHMETFYNMLSGKTRPRDPFIYVYFSKILNIELSEIIMRYSEVDSDEHEVAINLNQLKIK